MSSIIKHVRVAVFLAELDQRSVLNRVDELVGELLAGEIDHRRTYGCL